MPVDNLILFLSLSSYRKYNRDSNQITKTQDLAQSNRAARLQGGPLVCIRVE